MNKKTFFEYLAIASVERIHSQMIAWLLSKDFEALNDNAKNNLLRDILHIKQNIQIINITTEYDRLDILIETDNLLIALENKFTATTRQDQLNNYKCNIDQVAKEKEKQARYYLLSITGEEVRECKIWEPITYKHLLECLSRQKFSQNNHSIIIKEYIQYLKYVYEALDSFIANPHNYESVFTDGSKKKSEKLNINYKNNISRFIATNQLETIFQRALFKIRMDNIPELKNSYIINETRGTAVMDVFIPNAIIKDKKKEFMFFLAVQGKTIKAALGLYGVAYAKSTDKDIALYRNYLEHQKGSFGYNRFNPPKSKAYCSLSKNPLKMWWELTQDEFKQMLVSEMTNVTKISQAVLQLVSSKDK